MCRSWEGSFLLSANNQQILIMQIVLLRLYSLRSGTGLEDAPSPMLAFVTAGVWSLNKAGNPVTVQIPILNAGTLAGLAFQSNGAHVCAN